MQLPRQSIEHLLDHWPVARLATLGADGRPHVVPIVFTREGSQILSAVDAKPKSGRELARVRNIERQPLVSLLLDDYATDWSRLWWIRVDGMGSVLRDADAPEMAVALAGLRRKYPQYQETSPLVEPPTLLRVRITAVRSWCASPEAVPAADGV